MKLAYKLDSLDGLDEALKPLYAKDGDKFVLQVDDSGAKSAVKAERDRADAAEKALKDLKDAEAKALADAERAKLEAKGDYEKLSAADKAALKAAEDKAAALEAKLRDGARDRAAMDAIVASGGIPEALMPHVVSALEVVAEGDSFKVLVKGDPGKKVGDFVAGLKESKSWGFQPSGATGGGASTTTGGAKGKAWKDMSLDEQTQLYKSNPTQAQALQAGA